ATESAFNLYMRIWPGRAAVGRLLERRNNAFRAAAASPGTREDWGQLMDVRRQLARLFVNPPRHVKDVDQEARRLTDEKRKLENKLTKVLPSLADESELNKLGPADLQRLLPPRTAFIDLCRYTLFTQNPKQPGTKGEKRTA